MNNTPKPHPRFKTPILSVLYIFAGSIMLIAGGFMLLGSKGNMAAIAVGTGITLSGLIAFGVAQVITAICETAFNTRRVE
jgi:hypothetical protein